MNRRQILQPISILLTQILLSFAQPEKTIDRKRSFSRIQTIKNLASLEEVITKVLLAKKWDKNTSPLKKCYRDMKDFLQAMNVDKSVCDHATHNKYSNESFYRLFYMLPFEKNRNQIPPLDLNVLRVWTEDENFGDGVKVAIVCDDINKNHPALIDNYDPSIEFSFIHDGEEEPNMNNTSGGERPHVDGGKIGTRAAGLIAMSLEGGICGIGIAPKAKIGAIRLMDAKGKVNLQTFASALDYLVSEIANAPIDIILNPWLQNYSKIESEDQQYEEQIHRAYERSALQGRSGKGLINIVPVGKPARRTSVSRNRSCARNLHVNSIYTIAVAATEFEGRRNIYSAACAAIMVTAFSTDSEYENHYRMSTTDSDGRCTVEYRNTEAAASLVAGVVALVLRANSQLTYRDVQHLVAWTSEVSPILDYVKSWHLNKAGFYVSPFYGFGMINAYKMVQAAKAFQSVPPLITCKQPFTIPRTDNDLETRLGVEVREETNNDDGVSDDAKHRTFELLVDGCRGTENEVNYIEHIQLLVTFMNSPRGAVDIYLCSPRGRWVNLLKYEESNDKHGDQMIRWKFDSVMNWGEKPSGIWTVKMRFYEQKVEPGRLPAQLESMILFVHGTKKSPQHYRGNYQRRYRSYLHPTPYDKLRPEYEESCLDVCC